MAKLRWKNDCTVPERFAIQTDNVRGEGVCYSIMFQRREDAEAYRHSDIEGAFYGRGGKAKVKAAAQRIADLTAHTETHC